jgi:hypothetical protein
MPVAGAMPGEPSFNIQHEAFMGRELHVHSHPSRVEHWRHLIEIVALVVAAVWGLYVFVYQERIKPASTPPHLQPSVEVRHYPLDGGREFVDVKIDMTHSGGAPLAIAGMIVNVYGIRYGENAAKHVEKPMEGVTEISYTLTPSRPELLYTFLDTWRGFGAQKRFGGLAGDGDSFSESFSLVTRRYRYDAAKVEWQICWSRLGDKQWPVSPQRRPDGAFWFANVNSGGELLPGLYCSFQSRGSFFPL